MKLKVEHVDKMEGTIRVSGSKNATLPLMVCSLLTDEKIVLENVPYITDIMDMEELLKTVGVSIQYDSKENKMTLKKGTITPNLNIYKMGKIRASYYLMGAFIANGFSFEAYYPGGCNFSKRPIDYHLKAFRKMGYQIEEKKDYLYFEKKEHCYQKLIYLLPQKSVGTTINILLASSKSQVPIIIKNASLEPEVLDVIQMLKKMKVKITIRQSDITIINPHQMLKGTTFTVRGDRIEAGSYLLMGASLKNANLKIEGINQSDIHNVCQRLVQMGVAIREKKHQVHLIKNKKLHPIDLIIDVYPNFPTDLQPILCVTCTQACGISIIEDKVYPSRISHVEEIKKANGNIETIHKKIIVSTSTLKEAIFQSHDLRCGFACIILGALAEKESIIEDAEYIFRGYAHIITKLKNVGVNLSILSND